MSHPSSTLTQIILFILKPSQTKVEFKLNSHPYPDDLNQMTLFEEILNEAYKWNKTLWLNIDYSKQKIKNVEIICTKKALALGVQN